MMSPAPATSSAGGPSVNTGGGLGLAARCCSSGIKLEAVQWLVSSAVSRGRCILDVD